MQAIKRKVDETIDRYMRPLAVKPPRTPKSSLGNIVNLYTKWRGHDLILIAKRQGGIIAKRREEDFETKSGRLTLVGADSFDISYFRHTDKWFTISRDCTLKEALTYFQKPGPVWPW